jgi:iron-regulated transporter 1
MLYFTVLSLGFLMTSYLKSIGMAEATLAYFRGAGALSGLSATLLFPVLQRKWGLRRTGLMGITWQLAWLCGGVLAVVAGQKDGLQVSQACLFCCCQEPLFTTRL